MLALASGPATSRSSSEPGFWPSRTAMTGRRPSNSAGWLGLQRRSRACAVLRSRRCRRDRCRTRSWSRPNSAAAGLPVARWPAATRSDWSRRRSAPWRGAERRGDAGGGVARRLRRRRLRGRLADRAGHILETALERRDAREQAVAVGREHADGLAQPPLLGLLVERGGWRAAGPSRCASPRRLGRDQGRDAAHAGLGARRQTTAISTATRGKSDPGAEADELRAANRRHGGQAPANQKS